MTWVQGDATRSYSVTIPTEPAPLTVNFAGLVPEDADEYSMRVCSKRKVFIQELWEDGAPGKLYTKERQTICSVFSVPHYFAKVLLRTLNSKASNTDKAQERTPKKYRRRKNKERHINDMYDFSIVHPNDVLSG